MKKFKKAILSVSMSLIATSALAGNVNYIVDSGTSVEMINKISSMQEVKNTYELSSGYVILSVDEDRKGFVVDTLIGLGVSFEEDVKVTREKPETLGFSTLPVMSNVSPQSLSGDPLYSSQQNFNFNNLQEAMEYVRIPVEKPDVLIIDSGSYGHEDVYFEGGYNFVTEDDDSGRTVYDYLDYTDERDCLSGHGVAMAGVIGAKTGNGVGISGISDSNLYMARVISSICDDAGNSTDNGSLADLLKSLYEIGENTESKIPIPDVVNISLSAETVCPSYLQSAIDSLVERNVVVVVSAGNKNGLSANYTPGNCANVINVGSHDNSLNKSDFSNAGENVDLTVFESQFTTTAYHAVGTNYGTSTGTSGSAATVSSVVSIIKSQYPDAEPSKIEDVLKWSSAPYPESSSCVSGCGKGSLNAKQALVLADKLFDPSINFRHAFQLSDEGEFSQTCKLERQVDGLSSYMETCKAVIAEFDLSYVGVSDSLEYIFKIEKKLISGSNVGTWEQVGDLFMPEVGNVELPILGVEPSKYEYRVSSCFEQGGETFCPYPENVDLSTINFPSNCS